MDLMLAKWQLYVQSKMGLQNCQMDIDTPPFWSRDVVTSTCFPRILFMSHKLAGT